MSRPNPKQSFATLLGAFALVALAGCGPSQAPQSQTPAPPAAASVAPPPPPAAAPAPPPPAPTPPPQSQAAPVHHHHVAKAEPAPQVAEQQPAPPPVCSDCGVIASVEQQREKGDAGAIGTLGGAAAGGLLGNQFGHGKGKTAMTVIGAIGGAFAGREVQKQVNAKTVYRVTVNMEDGSQRVVTVDALNGLGVGSKVRVEGESLQYNGN